jgi:glycosyltransferase involved in cell wall biosynthesis
MRITFLLPSWTLTPSGGAKVVYEYGNRLVQRGHRVTIVHPFRLKYQPAQRVTVRQHIRTQITWARGLLSQPSVRWHPIDPRVTMLFVPSSDPSYIPNGDFLFATAWDTVASVLECGPKKGQKCYLIQGYEVWRGQKHLVDASWRSPLHKIVIAHWLKELGEQLGCCDLTYIPNAIDHSQYRIIEPIENRPRRVAMAFSRAAVKGSADGIGALELVRQNFPGLQAVFFSADRPDASIPKWIKFYRTPPQDFIVAEILNRSSVFLNPSLSEGWSLPTTEAAACGCAVVSTDNGGVREYVKHGVSGMLSPPGNSDALAQNLCRILENDELRVRTARECNRAVRRLDWEASVDILETFFRERMGIRGEGCPAIDICGKPVESNIVNGSSLEIGGRF